MWQVGNKKWAVMYLYVSEVGEPREIWYDRYSQEVVLEDVCGNVFYRSHEYILPQQEMKNMEGNGYYFRISEDKCYVIGE